MSWNLTAADFFADTGPQLARMRAAGPLVETRVPLIGRTWITTTDHAARALLKDPRFLRDFRADLETVRATSHPGLIRELVRAEDEGGRLSEEEVLSLVVLLCLVGHGTTDHLIADAIGSLLSDPALRAETLSDPACLPLAVEELLRFHSPAMMTKMHFAREDLVFEGCRSARARASRPHSHRPALFGAGSGEVEHHVGRAYPARAVVDAGGDVGLMGVSVVGIHPVVPCGCRCPAR